MLSKYIVKPAARIIGWPIERLAPTSGRLARDNAGRNPSRTAATAAALMIGLALVVFIAVFAQAMKGSFSGALEKSTRAELVVQDRTAYMGVPQKDVRALDGISGVDTASGTGYADLKIQKGGVTSAYAVDPATFARVWALDWRRGGSDALYSKLDAHHVLLEDGSPVAGKVKAGDTISVTTRGGQKAKLTVLGFYRDNMAFTGMITSLDAFKQLHLTTASQVTMVRVKDGANVGATQDAVQKALAAFPTQKVMTKAEYLDTVNKMIDQILMMFYGLLAMSVIISIFGIVNTLVLSVHERTREIGMLRAIGATRRQLRQMVRYESVITAVIGGVLGTAVGIGMAYVIVTQLGGDGLTFSLPWLQLGVFLVLAVVVGVVAAVLPARRAAGTRILEAIQYE
jgi:putative ABC transport system permease protein